jgi:hypothetical protein
MSGLSVSKESVLKNLANIGQSQSKAGRPRSEDKVKEEMESHNETGTDLGKEEEGYQIPIDEMFLPGEMADFQTQLRDSKPEDLKIRTTKLTFENRGLKRWIKNAITQLSNAEKGGKIMLPALPQGVPNALGVEDSNAGVTQMLKEIMPSITQYKLVRDMMKDEDGDSGRDKRMMEYESPDGMKIKMPAGSFMPGMGNPFMMGQENGAKGEPTIKIKVGDNEFEAPQSQAGLMYALMNQSKDTKEATVKIKGEDGEEREVPASAVGAILDLQKMSGGAKKDTESEITITDENGKEVKMPASFYPQYLMQLQLNKQAQELSAPRKGEHDTYRRPPPEDAVTSKMYGMMSEMRDAMKAVNEVVNPQKLSEMAMEGFLGEIERFNRLKTMFGGGGENDAVQKTRIEQQEQTKRTEIAEKAKAQREEERTKQAQAESSKFALMMGPAVGAVPEPTPEPENAGPSLDDAYKKTKAINEEFMMDLQEAGDSEEELDGELGEEEGDGEE